MVPVTCKPVLRDHSILDALTVRDGLFFSCNSTGGLINFPSDVTYSITHPVRTVHCLVSKHTANGTECWVQQFADIQLRNLYSFCCYPQDVNLSINLQRAATFGWHLTSNKDQTAVFPPEIAQSHSYFTRSRGVSKSSITLVKQLTALQWHHEFIAHKQVMLGWIGTVVCIMKNTTHAAQCRLCSKHHPFKWDPLQEADPCRSRYHSAKWMVTFQGRCWGKKNNNAPYCAAVGILISF